MRRGERAGFTLIELMIVVAILGILASVAIPSFMTFVRQAKAAEAYDVLKTLYGHAATYYIRENFTVGINGVQSRSCTVSSSDNKVVPSGQKVIGNYSDPGFHALGFTHEQSYFRFELINHHDAAGECSVPPSTPDVYAIRAIGDLDDDGVQSLIELATASDDNNELYHARSFYLSKETE